MIRLVRCPPHDCRPPGTTEALPPGEGMGELDARMGLTCTVRRVFRETSGLAPWPWVAEDGPGCGRHWPLCPQHGTRTCCNGGAKAEAA
jgi:hypothetical protein